jgi:hypothetical protein
MGWFHRIVVKKSKHFQPVTASYAWIDTFKTLEQFSEEEEHMDCRGLLTQAEEELIEVERRRVHNWSCHGTTSQYAERVLGQTVS